MAMNNHTFYEILGFCFLFTYTVPRLAKLAKTPSGRSDILFEAKVLRKRKGSHFFKDNIKLGRLKSGTLEKLFLVIFTDSNCRLVRLAKSPS